MKIVSDDQSREIKIKNDGHFFPGISDLFLFFTSSGLSEWLKWNYLWREISSHLHTTVVTCDKWPRVQKGSQKDWEPLVYTISAITAETISCCLKTGI